MAKPKLTTFTGVKAEDIAQALAERLPPEAYKGVPGGADLTDINTGFMIERLTNVFGVKGLGWSLDYTADAMQVISEGSRPMSRLTYAVFKYWLWDDQGNRVECSFPVSGTNQNSAQYNEEGARTSATGSAIKWLMFQNDVYKGLFDHHDAEQEKRRQPQSSGSNGNGSKPTQAPQPAAAPVVAWTPETAAEVLTPKKTKIGTLNTDQLSQLVTTVDTDRKEGKVISPELAKAYSAAKFLHDHRLRQSQPQAQMQAQTA